MKSYTIKKTESGSVDWSAVPILSLDVRYKETPSTAQAWAQIAYSEDALHVHLRATEPVIRAEESGPLGEPYHDSCLEFFFAPMEGDARYFNLEFNSNKCLYIGLGTGLPDQVRLIFDYEQVFRPRVEYTSDGWEIYYTVPFEFVRRFFKDFSVKAGKTVRANCYKCADMMTPGHFLSWSPVVSEPFTFHTPSAFGIMTFGE